MLAYFHQNRQKPNCYDGTQCRSNIDQPIITIDIHDITSAPKRKCWTLDVYPILSTIDQLNLFIVEYNTIFCW